MVSFPKQLSQRGLKLIAIASITLLTSGLATLMAGRAEAVSQTVDENLPDVAELADRSFDPRFCAEDLAPAMAAIVGRSQFATATWGIEVYPLLADQVIYEHNSQRFLIPASNIKLMTTAAAIQTIQAHSPDRLWAFRDDLNLVNRDSNNARADELLRGIGGQSQVKSVLESLGVDPES